MAVEETVELSPELREAIEGLLPRYPTKRAALIPILHRAQEECGALTPAVQQAVAEVLALPPIKVQEVVTFYTMLRQKPVGRYHLQICTNVACQILGAETLRDRIAHKLGIGVGGTTPDGRFTLSEVECLACCGTAPVVQVNDIYCEAMTPERVDRLLERPEDARGLSREGLPEVVPQRLRAEERIVSRNFEKPDSATLEVYEAGGGYGALRKALAMSPDAVMAEVKTAGVRGRGGAGFPAGVKWGFVPKTAPKPKYLCVNADEGEPGTFKDKQILEKDPHLLLEGIVIASFAVGIHAAYIYIRGEFFDALRAVQLAVAEAYRKGYLGKDILGSGFDLDVTVHPGAGAYICGEETGLIQSLEGRKGQPRLKPPFPAVVGAFGGPTVVNNVETLACVPSILERGGAWFAALGTERNSGTRLFGLSGHVEKPGYYELPMGYPLRDLIYDVGGGIRGGRRLKAVIPGGSSAPVLRADEIDVPMDFDSMAKAGTMAGSGAVIVMDETTCVVRVMARLAAFYAHESCGQCTPCREGTVWLAKMFARIEAGGGRKEDLDRILEVSERMLGVTICVLSDAAAMPAAAFVKKFRDEFEMHIEKRACPFPKFQPVAAP